MRVTVGSYRNPPAGVDSKPREGTREDHHDESPRIVSRTEWLDARKALLAQEKEFTRQGDALNPERRRLPMVRVDQDFAFEGRRSLAGLLDLFEGRQQLIVYHFMFDPSWEAGCPSCSFLTDNLGHLAHLHAWKTTLAWCPGRR